jgi:hypothetical protein
MPNARGHVFVRPAKPEDTQKFVDWSLENPSNGFDPEVARRSTTLVLTAYDKTGVIAYQPVQQVFMLESLATRPGEDKLRVAAAMKEFTQAVVTQCHLKDIGEVYFLATEEGTNTMAANHTFEEVPMRVFRMKVADLEGK